jgi:hypothetical protein|tara:strand:+ start:1202 stop:1381 length:180 start_codon:yes stop_codon:yes gene_type:complete
MKAKVVLIDETIEVPHVEAMGIMNGAVYLGFPTDDGKVKPRALFKEDIFRYAVFVEEDE